MPKPSAGPCPLCQILIHWLALAQRVLHQVAVRPEVDNDVLIPDTWPSPQAAEFRRQGEGGFRDTLLAHPISSTFHCTDGLFRPFSCPAICPKRSPRWRPRQEISREEVLARPTAVSLGCGRSDGKDRLISLLMGLLSGQVIARLR